MTTAIPTFPIVNAGIMYVSKLNLSYLSDFKLKLSSGAARDSSNVIDIIIQEDIEISSEYVGPNGLDVGVVQTSRSYAVYVIADSSNYNKTASILSLNAVSPKLPIGYDCFRRIGFVSTDLSTPTPKFIKFYQYGEGETKKYIYDTNSVATVLFEGNSVSWSDITITPAVIPAIKTEAYFTVKYEQSSALNSANLSPFGATATNGMIIISNNVSTQYDQITLPVEINTLGFASIKYRVGPTGTADKLTIYATGYKDIL